jgi:F0F1-type ATP synthase assembly protein I
VEKGRTIDGAIGENVSLVASIYFALVLFGASHFLNIMKPLFPGLLCVIVLRAKKELRVRKKTRAEGLINVLKIGC